MNTDRKYHIPFPLTFYVQHPLLQVFLETVGFVFPPCVAAHEVRNAVVAAELFSYVAGPAVYSVAVVVVEPEVFFVLYLQVAEFGGAFVAVVFAVPVSVADVSELQDSVDIVPAFDISVPASVVVV